tara:strand:+ start:276 stop:1538 length:1263 start_codon:yes stop_codon:yes gene_type:complete
MLRHFTGRGGNMDDCHMTGPSTILVIGTMDTKAAEVRFLRDRIAAADARPLVIDVSTSGGAGGEAEVTAREVARHHPEGPDAVFSNNRGDAVAAMSVALTNYIGTIDLAGAIGIGGSGGTAMIAPALRGVRLGIPKILVSTVASGNTSPYVDTSDLVLFPSVTDIGGLNRISIPILTNAAAAITGMVAASRDMRGEERHAIGLTMFGVTTPCVTAVADRLSSKYDPIVFHATGIGGRAMEELAEQGFLQGIADLTTTELCDRMIGGVMPAGPDRIDRLAGLGLPYVGSAGALDMINFGSPDTVPNKYADRLFYQHNPQITLMRTTSSECRRIGSEIAKSLNRFKGPAVFLIPERGVSALDSEGQPFHDPDADSALFMAVEENVRQTKRRRVIRLPYHINDTAFAMVAAHELENMMHEVGA